MILQKVLIVKTKLIKLTKTFQNQAEKSTEPINDNKNILIFNELSFFFWNLDKRVAVTITNVGFKNSDGCIEKP